MALARTRLKRAARLLSAGEALLSNMPPSVWHRYNVSYERHLKSVQEQLDAATFDAAWSGGHGLTEGEAIHLAMSDED